MTLNILYLVCVFVICVLIMMFLMLIHFWAIVREMCTF